MCLNLKVPGRPHPDEPFKRAYRLRTLSDSSFEQVGEGDAVERLVRLAAIMGGALCEELAMWDRSLVDGKPVDRRVWGSTSDGSFMILQELERLGAGRWAWARRIEALGKRSSTTRWDLRHLPKLMDDVMAAASSFAARRVGED